MDQFERIFRLHQILRSHRWPVSRHQLMDTLNCSEATVYRTVEKLRDVLDAPVQSDEQGGWYYPRQGEPFELPGLWFNASELHALLSVDRLLAEVQPGVLDEELEPLRERIRHIMARRHMGEGELAKRVRILPMASRGFSPEVFRSVASALVERRRLGFYYQPRSHDAPGEREVSPQRLTRFRDNWYLDAWCHHRDDLRVFSLDRIAHARLLAEAANDLSEAELDRRLASAYGIFSGEPEHTAVLRFDPHRARWIADEQWHPRQQVRWLEDGCYELQIPYGDPTELVLDILRYGDEVEVVEPVELREAVADRLTRALARYRKDPG